MPTTELTPREALGAIIFATKTAHLNQVSSEALADAIVAGLERRGLVIAEFYDVIDPPDEHLRTLKYIRTTVKDAIADTEAKRDMASLTRRLQDVSREVTTLEERYRAESTKRKTGNGSNTGSSTASSTGSLNI